MARDLEERIRKAENIASEYFDYLSETTPTPDYVQVVGSIGGEICTYRIYDDGSVYANRDISKSRRIEIAENE